MGQRVLRRGTFGSTGGGCGRGVWVPETGLLALSLARYPCALILDFGALGQGEGRTQLRGLWKRSQRSKVLGTHLRSSGSPSRASPRPWVWGVPASPYPFTGPQKEARTLDPALFPPPGDTSPTARCLWPSSSHTWLASGWVFLAGLPGLGRSPWPPPTLLAQPLQGQGPALQRVHPQGIPPSRPAAHPSGFPGLRLQSCPMRTGCWP